MADNGIIYFDEPDHRYSLTIRFPFSILIRTNVKFVAPYFADSDIRAIGEVFYRQTSDPSLLSRATKEIRAAFPQYKNVTMKSLLIATWYKVGYRTFSAIKTDKVSVLLETLYCVNRFPFYCTCG